MMKQSNVRSQYIKNLLAENDDIKDKLTEVTKESLKSVLDESLSKNLRNIISEAEDEVDTDSYEEEEVTTDAPENGEGEGTEDFGGDSEDFDEEGEDEGLWADLEQFKDENGEYDLTGMGKDAIAKILSQMDPNDGVRVVKNDDGTATVSSEDDDTEFIIEIDDEGDGEDFGDDDTAEYGFGGEEDTEMEDDEDGDTEFEVEMDDEEDDDDEITEAKNEFTDNYQDKDVIDGLSNDETSPVEHNDWDAGVPKGTKKPWAGKGNMKPYNESVEDEFEIELDDDDYSDMGDEEYDDMGECGFATGRGFNEAYDPEGEDVDFEIEDDDFDGMDDFEMEDETDPLDYEDEGDFEDESDFEDEGEFEDGDIEEDRAHGSYARGVGKSWTPDTETNRVRAPRNGSRNGRKVTSTSNNPTMGSRNEAIKRKVNNIVKENKQLKNIAGQMQKQLNEAIVINASLGKIVKLVTENSTSHDEKVQIIKAFNEARTINDTNRIYEDISRHLKGTVRNSKPLQNGARVDSQLSESKNYLVETPLYQSDDLAATLSLMERINRIK